MCFLSIRSAPEVLFIFPRGFLFSEFSLLLTKDSLSWLEINS